MSTNDNTPLILRGELEKLGAREFEVVALTMDPGRGLAALKVALERGAEHPLSYAIKLFDNDDWQPSGETKRHATNVSVSVECKTCGGDRFVLVGSRPPTISPWMTERGIHPQGLMTDEMAACFSCNPAADTTFRRFDGSLAKGLDPAKTRELMER